MGKIAFVFPGQGTQCTGMGQDLVADASAHAVFQMADSVRPETSAQCFTGDEATLAITCNTQPCLFTVELALAEALKARGLVADCVAGFSLGEVVALAYAEVAPMATMFELICQRGALMQEACDAEPAGMVAVLRLSSDEVVALAADFSEVYPVNFNCPGQVTVAGTREALAEFAKAVKEKGGRALPLKVKGGFHSPLMAEAGARFYDILKDIDFQLPQMAVYANATAMPYGEEVAPLLAKQLTMPVKWEQSIRQMMTDGVDTFIEVGMGDTLSGMIKRIHPEARLYHVATLEAIDTVCKEILVC